MPQLTQALKHQIFHDSPLATLLLRRAFRNRHRLGHAFFWHLKSEMHFPLIVERYGLLLESYLRGCGTHRKELLHQNQVIQALTAVSLKIKKTESANRLDVLHEELEKLTLPPLFQLPLDPRYEVKGIIISKSHKKNSIPKMFS